MLYAFFDGDDIGNTIEILLTEDKVVEAVRLSENIKLAMQKIEQLLLVKDDVQLILIGGDDILIEYNEEKYDKDILEEIMNIFKDITGKSMSCGVGDTLPNAIWCLHTAKLYGKNLIKGL